MSKTIDKMTKVLKKELKKINCDSDNRFWDASIIIFNPVDTAFYKIAFGNGTNSDDLEEGCDDYMYLQIDKYDEDGEFQEDYDGGQMDFNRKDYTGYINDPKLIMDCLDFMQCPYSENIVVVGKFNH